MPDFGGTKTLTVTSTAFQHGQPIPEKHTCEGQDVSPALEIGNIPPNAKSLVLICDDPDAPRGTWLHWTVWNMPPTMTAIREGAQNNEDGYREGMTDNKSVGYGGPCPPPGKPHRYFFKIYALSAMLGLPNGSNLKQLEGAMNGKVLAWGELMGTFKR
ncbi:MAG TPA: YbhB/YbcL family Raf kinase inhibitor-like protein [Candidatus Thermoplasmatota archaeon]